MILNKSLSGSSRVKTFSIYFLCGLLLFIGLLQLVVNLNSNSKEIKLNYPTKTYSKIEEEYRKRYNLMTDQGLGEETGEECTLGKQINYYYTLNI